MADPWSTMADEEDETYSGPDGYLDDDDDYTEERDRDLDMEDELEGLQEETQEAATYQNLIGG